MHLMTHWVPVVFKCFWHLVFPRHLSDLIMSQSPGSMVRLRVNTMESSTTPSSVPPNPLSDVRTQNQWRAKNLPNLIRCDRKCVNGLTSHHRVCVWRCKLFHMCASWLVSDSKDQSVTLWGWIRFTLQIATLKASCSNFCHITHSSFGSLICLLAQKHLIFIHFRHNKHEMYVYVCVLLFQNKSVVWGKALSKCIPIKTNFNNTDTMCYIGSRLYLNYR